MAEIQQHMTPSILVKQTLEQQNLSGLRKMLRYIAEYGQADGCILWEEAPYPAEQLYTLAHWFTGDQTYAVHNLSFSQSVTGTAILTGRTEYVPNVDLDERVDSQTLFLQKFQIQSFCSIPIIFPDNSKGALNLYSKSLNAFDKQTIHDVKEIASLIPCFTQAVHNQVSFNLLRDINHVLDKAETQGQVKRLSREQIQEFIQEICFKVSTTFQCIETSIFLEDPLKCRGKYELVASTWPWDINKKQYLANENHGLTGWVLTHRKTVQIFDLAHFERDKELIEQRYPSIRWNDPLNVETSVRTHLNIPSEAKLQPLSFIGIPIKIGDELLGVIRCSIAKRGPYYFASRSEELLKLVASRLAQAWRNWLNRRTIEEENQSLQNLVESISRLNRSADRELRRKKPQERRIFDKALHMVSETIDGADILDIRLRDEKSNELYFARTYGDAWKEGTRDEVLDRTTRRFPISDKATSAGAFVTQTGKVYLVSDADQADYYDPTFPERTKRFIVAPLKVQDEVLGVLDIRSIHDGAFPRNVQTIVELIAQQLGLYYHLVTTVATLKKIQERQIQIFEDLAHQLKSPVFQAFERTQLAVEQILLPDNYSRRPLFVIRGLCGKVKRVMMNIDLFPALAGNYPIQCKSSRAKATDMRKLMVEMASDHEFVLDQARGIRINVDKPSFNILDSILVELDEGLIEQAVNNMLDNAGKYSYDNTNIHISAGFFDNKFFYISVRNKGVPILQPDIEHCVERGWQGAEAKHVIGGGSGIGLWIVDHIMKAHKGELRIIPTTHEGWTEVQLIIRIKKRIR